ncbi:transposable element Tcb1 transposase [Trichonephila clavipes]|nr:transposable element Tcb1 transposase [Trichonephila clavipes]
MPYTAASVRAWFEEHQDEFTVLPGQQTHPDLNPPEHLWDHLDRVVRAMDPQPRNLAQLAAVESAWLNIPENTFRDLTLFLHVSQQSALRKVVILAFDRWSH